MNFKRTRYVFLGPLCTAWRREKKKVSLGDRPVSTSSIRMNIHADYLHIYIPNLFRHSPFGNIDFHESVPLFSLPISFLGVFENKAFLIRLRVFKARNLTQALTCVVSQQSLGIRRISGSAIESKVTPFFVRL